MFHLAVVYLFRYVFGADIFTFFCMNRMGLNATRVLGVGEGAVIYICVCCCGDSHPIHWYRQQLPSGIPYGTTLH